MKKNQGLIIGVVIAILVALLITYNVTQQNGNIGSVKIATNLPLTGALATYGASVRDGVNMALTDLKLTDPKGPQLSFDWQDNAGEPKTAVSIMQQQFTGSPDIYVSGVKPQTMAIIDQITKKGIPHFVWIFDPVINKTGNNNFRTWVSYKIEPPTYLDYAKKINAKRVAILYVQLPHTLEEFNNFVIPGLKKAGINDLLVEPYDFGNTDFKPAAAKIKKFNPDLIILNGFQNELVNQVRSLRPLKLIKDGNTIATYDMLDTVGGLGNDELEGIRQVAPTFVTRPDRPEVKEWTQRFVQQYNKQPLYTHAFAYDMAMIIHDAAKKIKSPSVSGQWMKALQETNMQGITGPLKFDSDGDLVTPLEVGVYRNGKLIPDMK